MNKPYFIDFEASGLGPNSYPIEAGWSDDKGNVESHLINPYHIDDWDDWDFIAQHNIHGISREQLRGEGKPPLQVAQYLNESLAGQEVFCDGLPYDRLWMECLFDYAEVDALFGLKHIDELLMDMLSGLQIVPSSFLQSKIEVIKIEARKRVSGPRHRAGNDALYLCEVYRLAQRAIGLPI